MGFWALILKWLRLYDSTDVTNTTTTNTTTVKLDASKSKKALCIGINDYPGYQNDLKGCLNDARNWTSLLKSRYYFTDVKQLLDKAATKANIKKALTDLIKNAKDGDVLVVTYSGHGTSVKDTNGDEEDGRDEAICCYDGNMIDDEIREIIAQLPQGAKLTFISDSCHSGTVTRSFMSAMVEDSQSRPRYMPPEDDLDGAMLASLPLKKAIFYPEEDMKEVLISGCLPTEYSYDTRIRGQATGAFSYYAIDILKGAPKITYKDFYKKLREKLPSGAYPQTPQLEGSTDSKDSLMFE